MDKEQKEIELKKLAIERAKVLEGILRTLVFGILTLGAGAGTIIYTLYNTKEVNLFLLSLLSTFIIVFSFLALWVYLDIKKTLKEVKKWK